MDLFTGKKANHGCFWPNVLEAFPIKFPIHTNAEHGLGFKPTAVRTYCNHGKTRVPGRTKHRSLKLSCVHRAGNDNIERTSSSTQFS